MRLHAQVTFQIWEVQRLVMNHLWGHSRWTTTVKDRSCSLATDMRAATAMGMRTTMTPIPQLPTRSYVCASDEECHESPGSISAVNPNSASKSCRTASGIATRRSHLLLAPNRRRMVQLVLGGFEALSSPSSLDEATCSTP